MSRFPADEMWAWCRRHLWIQGPKGPQLYTPIALQKEGEAIAAWQGVAGWYVLIKFRQGGFTVQCIGGMLALSTLRPGSRIMLGMPKEQGYYSKWRNKLAFSMARLSPKGGREPNAESGWPGWAALDRERLIFRNGSSIAFEYMGESIEAAGNFGQGDTYDLAILNELPHAKSADIAAKAVQSFSSALERNAAPVIVDAAPDADKDANRIYYEIVRDIQSGRMPGEVKVAPWWIDPTKAIPVRDRSKYAATYTLEEQALVAEHGLRPEQVAFRRKQHSKPGMSEARARAVALSQYPETVHGAFSVQQASVFPYDVMERLGAKARLNAFAAPRLTNPRHLPSPRWGVPWREIGEGYLRIYREPVGYMVRDVHKGRCRYHLGADPSDGLAQSDGQGLWLLDDLGNACVEGRLWLPPIVFAAVVQTLLEWFGAHGVVEDQKGELAHRYVNSPISLQEIRQEAPPEWWQLCMVLQQPCKRLQRVRTSTGKRNTEIQGSAYDLICAEPSACVSPEMLDEMRLISRKGDNFIVNKKAATDHIKSPDGFKALGIAGALWKATQLQVATNAASTMRRVAAHQPRTGRYLPARKWR